MFDIKRVFLYIIIAGKNAVMLTYKNQSDLRVTSEIIKSIKRNNNAMLHRRTFYQTCLCSKRSVLLKHDWMRHSCLQNCLRNDKARYSFTFTTSMNGRAVLR